MKMQDLLTPERMAAQEAGRLSFFAGVSLSGRCREGFVKTARDHAASLAPALRDAAARAWDRVPLNDPFTPSQDNPYR